VEEFRLLVSGHMHALASMAIVMVVVDILSLVQPVVVTLN
jgi:hypothetical protein